MHIVRKGNDMSCDQKIPDFEAMLLDENTNNLVEGLIKDGAFSIEFLASCVAHYYATVINKQKDTQ